MAINLCEAVATLEKRLIGSGLDVYIVAYSNSLMIRATATVNDRKNSLDDRLFRLERKIDPNIYERNERFNRMQLELDRFVGEFNGNLKRQYESTEAKK